MSGSQVRLTVAQSTSLLTSVFFPYLPTYLPTENAAGTSFAIKTQILTSIVKLLELAPGILPLLYENDAVSVLQHLLMDYVDPSKGPEGGSFGTPAYIAAILQLTKTMLPAADAVLKRDPAVLAAKLGAATSTTTAVSGVASSSAAGGAVSNMSATPHRSLVRQQAKESVSKTQMMIKGKEAKEKVIDMVFDEEEEGADDDIIQVTEIVEVDDDEEEVEEVQVEKLLSGAAGLPSSSKDKEKDVATPDPSQPSVEENPASMESQTGEEGTKKPATAAASASCGGEAKAGGGASAASAGGERGGGGVPTAFAFSTSTDEWSCTACTYLNPPISKIACEMCGSSNPSRSSPSVTGSPAFLGHARAMHDVLDLAGESGGGGGARAGGVGAPMLVEFNAESVGPMSIIEVYADEPDYYGIYAQVRQRKIGR